MRTVKVKVTLLGTNPESQIVYLRVFEGTKNLPYNIQWNGKVFRRLNDRPEGEIEGFFQQILCPEARSSNPIT